jgi:hypothetical protein
MDFGAINFPEISIPALLLIGITSLILVSGSNSRWLPLILGFQYIGVFLFVYLTWPIDLALVKLAAGWMASLLLSVGQMNSAALWEDEDRSAPSSSIFRILVTVLAGLTIFSLGSQVKDWFPRVGIEALLGGMGLIVIGLIHIGLTSHPLRVSIGLLTVLSGFEIIYASLENSVLVAGLLAALNLGLALVGVYLAAAPGLEEFE